jgi:hypothetical protein
MIMPDNHGLHSSVTAHPDIVITPQAHEVIANGIKALANETSLYQRGGALVRILRDTSPAGGEGGIRRPLAARIDLLPLATVLEKLTSVANWWEVSGDKLKPALPPMWCLKAVHARGDWPSVPFLEGITEYPVLRPDGTLLVKPGYDPQTGLLFESGSIHGKLKNNPKKGDAQKAVATLLEPLCDFPFADRIHQAAWLAALLTPLARFGFEGPAPFFLVDSNVRGAGKGLLLHAISYIITGERFTVASYTRDGDELRKRITSLALAGERLVLFDNLSGPFGDAVLDAALTATSWSDRLLGCNRMTRVPLYCTWYGTGNNVQIDADTARRCCHIRLESEYEKPELRDGFRYPDLLVWVREQRGRLLSAALTILHAYCLEGRPKANLPAWGSFEGWSDLVRQAVVWAGLPDPAQTRLELEATADTTAECMAVLLDGLERMDPAGTGLLASEIIDYLFKKDHNPKPVGLDECKDAVEGLCGKADARRLGYRLRLFRRRIFAGRYLEHAAGGGQRHCVRWVVRHEDSFRRRSREPGQDG